MINELGKISTSGGVLLKMWEVIVPSGSRPLVRHSHIRFEITLITEGSGIYTIGDKKYAIKPYEIFVLMPLGWFAQRANQTTTRYAGVRKKLYKKIPLSSTIRLFKS